MRNRDLTAVFWRHRPWLSLSRHDQAATGPDGSQARRGACRTSPAGSSSPNGTAFGPWCFAMAATVEILSKSGKSLARYFPEIVALVAEHRQPRFVLDGELILPIGDVLSFDALQARLHPAESRVIKLSRETPAQLMLFDCLDRRRHRPHWPAARRAPRGAGGVSRPSRRPLAAAVALRRSRRRANVAGAKRRRARRRRRQADRRTLPPRRARHAQGQAAPHRRLRRRRVPARQGGRRCRVAPARTL